MNERNPLQTIMGQEAMDTRALRSIDKSHERAEKRGEARKRTWERVKAVFSAGKDVVGTVLSPVAGGAEFSVNLLHRTALGFYGLRRGVRRLREGTGAMLDKGFATLEARRKEAKSADLRREMENVVASYKSLLAEVGSTTEIVEDDENGELYLAGRSTEFTVADEFADLKDRIVAQLDQMSGDHANLKKQADKLDAAAADLRSQSRDYLKRAQDLSFLRRKSAQLFGLRQGKNGYNLGKIRRQKIGDKFRAGGRAIVDAIGNRFNRAPVEPEDDNLGPDDEDRDGDDNTEDLTPEEQEKKRNSLNDVPAQVWILNGLKPVLQAGINFFARSKARGIGTAAASLAGLGEFASPVAGAAVGLAADTILVALGGGAALYDSAAQQTAAGLTTGWAGDRGRTGSESEAEYQKNINKGKYLRGLSGLPLFLLRKVGMGFNALRSAAVQVALRVTQDRSIVSQNMDKISSDLEKKDVENTVVEQKLTDWVNGENVAWKDVRKLGLALSRLRAFGGDTYGDKDVYGEEGSGMHPVNKNHDSEQFKVLHEALNRVVMASEKFDEKQKQEWAAWYDDDSRKGKGHERVALALAGSAAGTFATLGFVTAFRELFGDKISASEAAAQKEGIKNQIKQQGEQSAGTSTDQTTETPIIVEQTTIQGGEQIPEVLNPDGVPIPEDLIPDGTVPEGDGGFNLIDAIKGFIERGEITQEEIVGLGNDQVPWNAILSKVLENPEINSDSPLGITDVIKDIWKAAHVGLDVGTIGPNSNFALFIGNEIPTSLHEGTVAWFFSEDAINNLGLAAEQAFQAQASGEELTTIQQIMVDLRDNRMNYQDLATPENRQYLQQLFNISSQE